ncbi:MAG: hypothetical protein KTR31_37575 [Myxococcales bacterium]|nr:hypothetical protein [Myxococcales bacterium]
MRPDAIARIAAVCAPLPALLTLAVALSPTDDDLRADRNAGQVLGGQLRPDGIDQHLRRVVRQGYKVWVLGNSNAHTDVDPVELAAGLGVRPRDIAVLSIPNANAAHWVAMLRTLRDAAQRPELVLVVSRLQLVLVDVPISEESRRSLQVLLGPEDSDLLPLAAPAGQRVSQLFRRREALRDDVSAELRDWVPRWLLDARRPDDVLRRQLSDEHVDIDRLGRPPPRPLPAPEDSLVPLLTDTAYQLEVPLVVVRPPASPLVRPEEADNVPAGYAERTAALLGAKGASFVDMSALRMRPFHYKNADHLDEDGSLRLTRVLTRALAEPSEDRRVGAVGELRFEAGQLTQDLGLAHYPRPVPDVEGPGLAEAGSRSHVQWLDAPHGVPSDVWTMDVTTLASRCSPVVVTPLWEEALQRGWPCRDLVRGTSCHGPERLGYAPASDVDAPVRLALDPQRACDGARWLYPGDRLQLQWPDLAKLGGPPTHLELEAETVRSGVSARVALRTDGVRVVRGRLEGGTPLVLELPFAVEAPVLLLDSDGFLLLTRAELVRR